MRARCAAWRFCSWRRMSSCFSFGSARNCADCSSCCAVICCRTAFPGTGVPPADAPDVGVPTAAPVPLRPATAATPPPGVPVPAARACACACACSCSRWACSAVNDVPAVRAWWARSWFSAMAAATLPVPLWDREARVALRWATARRAFSMSFRNSRLACWTSAGISCGASSLPCARAASCCFCRYRLTYTRCLVSYCARALADACCVAVAAATAAAALPGCCCCCMLRGIGAVTTVRGGGWRGPPFMDPPLAAFEAAARPPDARPPPAPAPAPAPAPLVGMAVVTPRARLVAACRRRASMAAWRFCMRRMWRLSSAQRGTRHAAPRRHWRACSCRNAQIRLHRPHPPPARTVQPAPCLSRAFILRQLVDGHCSLLHADACSRSCMYSWMDRWRERLLLWRGEMGV